MARWDIKDQYGGKIGEIREETDWGKVSDNVIGGIVFAIIAAILFAILLVLKPWFNLCRFHPKFGIPLTIALVTGGVFFFNFAGGSRLSAKSNTVVYTACHTNYLDPTADDRRDASSKILDRGTSVVVTGPPVKANGIWQWPVKTGPSRTGTGRTGFLSEGCLSTSAPQLS